MTCPFCDCTFDHYHTEMTAPSGEIREVIMRVLDEPRAEVRDSETGEVIFPAIKGPLRLVPQPSSETR